MREMDVILWALGGLGALMGWALKLLHSVDKKMTGVETWKSEHDKQDDMRHKENLDKFDDIFEEIRSHRRNGPWKD